jgi:hypothetical protein
MLQGRCVTLRAEIDADLNFEACIQPDPGARDPNAFIWGFLALPVMQWPATALGLFRLNLPSADLPLAAQLLRLLSRCEPVAMASAVSQSNLLQSIRISVKSTLGPAAVYQVVELEIMGFESHHD